MPPPNDKPRLLTTAEMVTLASATAYFAFNGITIVMGDHVRAVQDIKKQVNSIALETLDYEPSLISAARDYKYITNLDGSKSITCSSIHDEELIGVGMHHAFLTISQDKSGNQKVTLSFEYPYMGLNPSNPVITANLDGKPATFGAQYAPGQLNTTLVFTDSKSASYKFLTHNEVNLTVWLLKSNRPITLEFDLTDLKPDFLEPNHDS